jgi:hypothetical protein
MQNKKYAQNHEEQHSGMKKKHAEEKLGKSRLSNVSPSMLLWNNNSSPTQFFSILMWGCTLVFFHRVSFLEYSSSSLEIKLGFLIYFPLSSFITFPLSGSHKKCAQNHLHISSMTTTHNVFVGS